MYLLITLCLYTAACPLTNFVYKKKKKTIMRKSIVMNKFGELIMIALKKSSLWPSERESVFIVHSFFQYFIIKTKT